MQKVFLPEIRFNPQADTVPEMRERQYKVTLCMVPYKNEHAFMKVLNQIMKVDYDNYETIIIDNSPDEKIARRVEKHLSERFRYMRNNNRGMLSGATNLAVREARGQYLVYVCTNHVRVYSHDWLRHMVEYFDESRKKKEFVLGGDVRPGIGPTDKHVQGGLFIADVDWLLRRPFDEKNTPFSLMDVKISRTAIRDRKFLLQIPYIWSSMDKWTRSNHNANMIKRKYKIVHSHGVENY